MSRTSSRRTCWVEAGGLAQPMKLHVEESGRSENPMLASHLPGVRRLTIPGVSHWLMLDDPAASNRALDEVLR